MVDLAGLEERARAILGRGAYDFVAGGADAEETLGDNVAGWSRMRIRPRVLRDVRQVSTSVKVLATELATPLLVAPIGFQRVAHPDGEEATTRGARAAGALMVAPTRSSVEFERVGGAASGPWWCQVYLLRDRGLTEALVDRAVEAGATALVLTVDTPFLGRRRRDQRNAFTLPEDVTTPNLPEGARAADVGERIEGARQSPAVGFGDISWLEGTWGLPIVAKGVLRGDDALACVEAGASAVVVSNHGGRQLDTAVATADALEEVVAAVGGRAEVYVDGGIRRGSDILKALALGAGAVLVGRPVIWGLACGGAKGVAGVLGQLREELALAMALCGAPEVADLTADLVARSPSATPPAHGRPTRSTEPSSDGEPGAPPPFEPHLSPPELRPAIDDGMASPGSPEPRLAEPATPSSEDLDPVAAPGDEPREPYAPDDEMTEVRGPLT